MIKVCLVEDDPDARAAVEGRLRSAADFELLGSYASARDAVQAIPQLEPDLVVMDLMMSENPEFDGIRGVQELIASCRAGNHKVPRCVVWSIHNAVDAWGRNNSDRAYRGGAWGYLVKSADGQRLLQYLRHVHEASDRESVFSRTIETSPRREGLLARLTESEAEVALLNAFGRPVEEIASITHRDVHTVRIHLRSARGKVDARTNEELTALVRGDLDMWRPLVTARKYVLREIPGAGFLWMLIGAYGETLLTSRLHATREDADADIAMCKGLTRDPDRYEQKRTPSKLHRFTLRTAEGAIVGASDPHLAERAIEDAIASCLLIGGVAETIDLT